VDEEIKIKCFDGSSKIILNSALPLHDADNRITGAIIVNQDITSRKREEQELLHAKSALEVANRELHRALEREQVMARTDDLTGVNNRRHFLDLATREFAVAQRYQHPLSVLLIDVDHFKQVNDTFGHQVGDAILKRVAQIAREYLRDADVLARYGGEEFIVSLPNTDAHGAFIAAEHIRRAIAERGMQTGNEPVRVTISAGVAEISGKEDTLDRLIQRADQALYTAKTAGRNRTVVFSPTA
jgi:diguanylate cyclase (GGDEF)-like protein